MVCTGCGMKGSHKVDKCWKIHPELKPRNMVNGKEERDRGRHREKSRSRSREKEGEGKKIEMQCLPSGTHCVFSTHAYCFVEIVLITYAFAVKGRILGWTNFIVLNQFIIYNC